MVHVRPSLIFVFVLAVGGPLVYAQSSEPAPEYGTTILLLESQISSQLFLRPKGIATMQEASAVLTQTQRQILYTTYQKRDALMGLAVNFVFPGLGSGVVQSDWGGAALAAGLYLLGGSTIGLAFTAAESGWGIPEPIFAAMPYIGATLAAAAYAIGIVRPFGWVSRWNKSLSQALGAKVGLLEQGRPGLRLHARAPEQGRIGDLILVSLRY